jgi:hypothetical protein
MSKLTDLLGTGRLVIKSAREQVKTGLFPLEDGQYIMEAVPSDAAGLRSDPKLRVLFSNETDGEPRTPSTSVGRTVNEFPNKTSEFEKDLDSYLEKVTKAMEATKIRIEPDFIELGPEATKRALEIKDELGISVEPTPKAAKTMEEQGDVLPSIEERTLKLQESFKKTRESMRKLATTYGEHMRMHMHMYRSSQTPSIPPPGYRDPGISVNDAATREKLNKQNSVIKKSYNGIQYWI